MLVKERRTKILLLIFLVTDVQFQYVSITDSLQSVFDLTFNQKTKGTISGLIRESLIEKNPSASENENSYKLTEKDLFIMSGISLF